MTLKLSNSECFPYSEKNLERKGDFFDHLPFYLENLDNSHEILTKIYDFFDQCDTTDKNTREAANLASAALIKKAFPFEKTNFERFNYNEPLIPYINPNSTIFLMYKAIKKILESFPESDTFDFNFLDKIFEYSNTTDISERRLLIEIGHYFILTHTNMLKDIVNRIFTRLSLVFDDADYPIQVYALLAAFSCIASNTSYFKENNYRDEIIKFIFPLMKLEAFPVFSDSYASTVFSIIKCEEFYYKEFILQLEKYWPRSNPRKIVIFSQIICSMIKKSIEQEEFAKIFPILKSKFDAIIDSRIYLAIDVIINLFNQIVNEKFSKEYGQLIQPVISDILLIIEEEKLGEREQKMVFSICDKLFCLPENMLNDKQDIKNRKIEEDKQSKANWLLIEKLSSNTKREN